MCENLILFKEGKCKDEEEEIRYIHRHAYRPAAQQPALADTTDPAATNTAAATTNTTAPTANAEQRTDTNAATSSSTSKPAAKPKAKAKVKINLKNYLNKKPVAIRLSPLGTKVPGPLQDHEWG